MTTRTKKSALLPDVLRSQHQWLRWRALLTLGILGLAATLAAIWIAHFGWLPPSVPLADIWGIGLAATVVLVFIASRFSPESLLATARQLDGRFAAKGRLEAAAILKDSDSPLAQAQREETALYLARETQARTVHLLPWLRGILVALILAHLATLLLWFVPMHALAVTAKPPIAATPPPQGPAEASINWQSPEAATEANPAAEVPATATVESTTGLKNLTLEVSVNGVVKKTNPLPADAALTPGSHEVKVALHLDEMKTQPFDVVSYYLHGQRVSAEPQPDTTSPVQFVQVRPFRDASRPPPPSSAPGVPPPINPSEALGQLELAQLQAMQDNFALAHTELPQDDPARAKETARVQSEQSTLAARTDDIAKALADEHVPAAATDPLHQAEPQMVDSAKKIAAAQNSAATDAQQKALDLIEQGEKSVYQAESTPPTPTAAPSNQTYTDSPPHPLTPREQTLLGQLETLARNQTHLAQDVGKTSDDDAAAPSTSPTTTAPPATPSNPSASATPPPAAPPIDPFGPDAEKGSLAERQQRVVQGIATLAKKAPSLSQAGHDALAYAQKDSAAALQQLSSEQTDAAREPAAAAALDLQQTIHALNQSGDEETRQALAQAQQQLNAAASQLRSLAQSHPADTAASLMNVATEVHDVTQELQGAADHQQDAGSAQGAAQLNQLASQVQDRHVAPDLAAMSKSGLDPGRANAEADTLESLAGEAASGTTPAQPSAQDVAGLANSLERTEATLAHLADKAGEDSSSSTSTSNGARSSSSSTSAANLPNGTTGSQPGQQSTADSPADSPGSLPGQHTASSSSSSGQQPSQQPGQQASSDQAGEKPAPATLADASTSQAFHEALQDLKNQAQQSAKLVPNGDAGAVEQVIIRYDKDTSYRDVTGVDVVRFHVDLQQPLEKLIVDVQALQQHEQRGEVVKTPDLDETPAIYRPAVSHYFEDISRDYHAPAPSHP